VSNWFKVVGKVHKLASTVFRDESLAAAACRKLIPTLLPACHDATRPATSTSAASSQVDQQTHHLILAASTDHAGDMDAEALFEYCKSNWLKVHLFLVWFLVSMVTRKLGFTLVDQPERR